MKKWLAAFIVTAILILLAATNSMYVENLELPIIIIGSALLALMVRFPEDKREKLLANTMRTFAAFVFGWIFSVLDVLFDHLLYFQPTGFEDGAYLTLSFKYEEFSSGFFLLSLYCMATAAVLLILVSLFKFLKQPKNARFS